MSDTISSTTGDGRDTTTKAKGRREQALNIETAEDHAREKRAEQHIHAIEHDDTPADPDQLRGEIAEARDELGETVEALAAKVDVKSRVKETIANHKARAQAKLGQATERVKHKPGPIAAAGGVAAILLLMVLRRRRR